MCRLSRGHVPALQEVHSFDLVSTAPGVVACNMAAVPLEDACIDAAVFCLALMGTDYGSFLQVPHTLQLFRPHANPVSGLSCRHTLRCASELACVC